MMAHAKSDGFHSIYSCGTQLTLSVLSTAMCSQVELFFLGEILSGAGDAVNAADEEDCCSASDSTSSYSPSVSRQRECLS